MKKRPLVITSSAVVGIVTLGVLLYRHDETAISLPARSEAKLPAVVDARDQLAPIIRYPAAPKAQFARPSDEELQRQRIEGKARLKLQIEAGLVETIDQTYVPILSSFGLSNEVVAKLRDLLIERWMVSRDAIELGNPETNQTAKAVLEEARAEVDRELANLVDPETGQKIKLMLQASYQLGGLSGGLAETFAKLGAPLTPQQQYVLAVTDYQVYFGPGSNPDGGQSLPIDPSSGLNKLDREYLARLEGSLSVAQIDIARQRRVNIHRREKAIYSTTPVNRIGD